MEKAKHQVLYWADYKKTYSRHLIKKLSKFCPDHAFTILDEIADLANPDFDLEQYDIIMLQSTDVTKFSSNEEERDCIGERLDEFTDNGKKLIISHDVIYRRTRNTLIQDMYNYQINNFFRERSVKYTKTAYCKRVGAFDSLKSIFTLNDGEICWGNLKSLSDKIIFFDTIVNDPVSNKKIIVPLLFGKVYNGDGQLIWFNTGDTYEDPPQPITNLDDNFVHLLAECIHIDLKNLKDKDSDGKAYLPYLHKCDFSKPFSFICYSSSNSVRVYEICLFLDRIGVNYFLDFKNITSSTPGSDGWKETVNDALHHENCTSSFVFLSEDFLESDHCYYEIHEMCGFKESFVPIIFSLSLDIERIVEIINSWLPLIDADKINTFKDILAIKRKHNSVELELNQLVYHCHRNMSQFKNVQLMESIAKYCSYDHSISLNDEEEMARLIQECKETSSKLKNHL